MNNDKKTHYEKSEIRRLEDWIIALSLNLFDLPLFCQMKQ